MSKKNNLILWNQVCDSDPKTLKKLNFGGFKPTVIDAQSQVKKATEIFGPMGIGWGIEKETRHFEEGMLFYSAILWYKLDGETGAVAICSDIKIKNDCMKSVQTDALTKGLSRIGFNSDVFENQWDGDKYIGLSKEKPTTKESIKKKFTENTTKEKNTSFNDFCYSRYEKVKYGFDTIKKKSYAQCTNQE